MLTTIHRSNDGVTLLELLAQHPDVARRTAQRWIALWVKGGQIRVAGRARARRYFGVAQASGAIALIAREPFPSSIPISPESEEILAYLDQPIEARKPVGYQREFLDAYVPNETWYLSATLRRQLQRIGKTAQAGEAAGTFSRAKY